MSTMIAMLRGVNVGGHNKIKMPELKALCESLGCTDVKTYIQSGNVVFKTTSKDSAKMGKKIGDAIEKKYGFCPEVMVRSAEEMKAIIAGNPFAKRKGIEPGKLVVMFLTRDPGETARKAVLAIDCAPEELKPVGSEIYAYFPNGMGRPKLKFAHLDKALGEVSSTARNWNTVMKLVEMSE